MGMGPCPDRTRRTDCRDTNEATSGSHRVRVARALGVTPMRIWRGLARGAAALRARGHDPQRLVPAALK